MSTPCTDPFVLNKAFRTWGKQDPTPASPACVAWELGDRRPVKAVPRCPGARILKYPVCSLGAQCCSPWQPSQALGMYAGREKDLWLVRFAKHTSFYSALFFISVYAPVSSGQTWLPSWVLCS